MVSRTCGRMPFSLGVVVGLSAQGCARLMPSKLASIVRLQHGFMVMGCCMPFIWCVQLGQGC